METIILVMFLQLNFILHNHMHVQKVQYTIWLSWPKPSLAEKTVFDLHRKFGSFGTQDTPPRRLDNDSKLLQMDRKYESVRVPKDYNSMVDAQNDTHGTSQIKRPH